MSQPSPVQDEPAAPVAIPVPPAARARLQGYHEALLEAKRRQDAFIAGIALTMGIPDGWLLDFARFCFIPPSARRDDDNPIQ